LTGDLEDLLSNACTDTVNVYVKFHCNYSTKYSDIASRGTGVNGQRTDGRRDDPMTYCLRRGLLDGGGKI